MLSGNIKEMDKLNALNARQKRQADKQFQMNLGEGPKVPRGISQLSEPKMKKSNERIVLSKQEIEFKQNGLNFARHQKRKIIRNKSQHIRASSRVSFAEGRDEF